jgi:dipeptidyl aminopeptidase/acylaminoacyl peptidase
MCQMQLNPYSINKYVKMKTIWYLLVACSSICHGQQNGFVLSRTTVTLPLYDDSPSIEMYYDRDTYISAVEDKGVKIEKVVYRSDGLKVVAYLSSPAEPGKKVYPVIIFNRGSGVRNDISYVHAPLFKKLVYEGFIVIAPALRGSEGGEGTDEVGGDDLNDIMNILPLLKQIPQADSSNLFMLGESRGGIMTFLALKRKFPLRAAATVGAITDMAFYLKDRPWAEEFFRENFPSYEENKDSILRARSAIYWADQLEVPLLLMNGQADPQVVPGHALNLAGRLSELGKEYQLIILQGGNHILSGIHTEKRDREVVDWFKKYIN